MGTENTIFPLFDQNLETRTVFRNPARGIPARRILPVHPEVGTLLPRRAFGKANGREWRNREHDCRHWSMFDASVIAFEQVRGDNSTFICCHGRELRQSARRSISSGVDGRIGDTLQILVYLYSALFRLHPGGSQIQITDLWNTTGTVNYQLRLKHLSFITG